MKPPVSRQKSFIIDLAFRHPLVGTWILPDGTYAEYTISAVGDTCSVSGVDTSDGEAFVISDIQWTGDELRFTSLMPSTDYELTHVIRLLSEGQIEHTWTRVEVWYRKADSN